MRKATGCGVGFRKILALLSAMGSFQLEPFKKQPYKATGLNDERGLGDVFAPDAAPKGGLPGHETNRPKNDHAVACDQGELSIVLPENLRLGLKMA